MKKLKVIAAMSGGVDSAVAAARAVDAGYEVVGVHLALSSNPQKYRSGARGCCTIEDSHDARRAADVIVTADSVTALGILNVILAVPVVSAVDSSEAATTSSNGVAMFPLPRIEVELIVFMFVPLTSAACLAFHAAAEAIRASARVPVHPTVNDTACSNAVNGVPPRVRVTLVSSTLVSAAGVMASCLPLKVDQFAEDKAPLFTADAVGKLKV